MCAPWSELPVLIRGREKRRAKVRNEIGGVKKAGEKTVQTVVQKWRGLSIVEQRGQRSTNVPDCEIVT